MQSFVDAAPTNRGCIISSTENKLGSSIIARADVRDVGLSANEHLGTEINKKKLRFIDCHRMSDSVVCNSIV